VPSRIPEEDGELMDFETAKGYLLLAGLLNSFSRKHHSKLLVSAISKKVKVQSISHGNSLLDAGLQ